MADTMRGVHTSLIDIRRNVFREVAKLMYSIADYPEWTDEVDRKFDELPFDILPGDVASFRESVFLERAIIGERIRLAMGLNPQGADSRQAISEGFLETTGVGLAYYEPPLINVIKFACNACEDNVYRVSSACQGCLAHPCQEICPKGAISFKNKKAFIDHEKCIGCGRCAQVCPYHAVHHHVRPCAEVCGMKAISSDEHGRAQIDHERCVSCGQCLINCPFGAIADKSQIGQVIYSIIKGEEVIAAVAPAFVGQFGGQGNVGKLREAFKQLGFAGVEEVAIGADLCAVEEADDFIEEVVDGGKPFMATSCCPAWSAMAKMEFTEQAECISMALTPMTLTARMIRTQHPHAKIVFVGPCSAKKLEAMRTSVRSEVDFVLTFEEMAGMMEAKEIDYLKLEDDNKSDFDVASEDGRNFAVSGGVANAVVNVIKRKDPSLEVKVHNAEGLNECRQMLKEAVRGKWPGYLLEGMACPGGCVAGAGTLQPINKSKIAVQRYAKRSPHKNATDNAFRVLIHALERDEDSKGIGELLS